MDRRKTDRRRAAADIVQALDIKRLARAVLAHKFIVAAIILLPLVLGAALLLSRPKLYEARASIIIEDQEIRLSDFANILPSPVINDMTVDTQGKVIASTALSRAVIDQLGLRLDSSGTLTSASAAGAPELDDAARFAVMKAYAKALKVQPQGASRIIEVSFTSHDPYLSARVVNAHTQEYVQSQIDTNREQVKQLNDWIGLQVTQLKEESIRKAQAVQAYRQQHGIVEGNENSQDLIFQQISDISAELIPVEARKLDLQARYDALTAADGEDEIIEVINSPLVQDLKAQASNARQELQSLAASLGKRHPDYLSAQKRVGQINRDISSEIARIKTSIKSELDSAIQNEILLNQRLEELKTQAGTLREQQIELQSLKLEEAASSKVLDSFLGKYDQVASQLDLARAGVRIVSKADIPMEPVGSGKVIQLFIIGIFASAVAVAVAAGLSLLDRRIETPDDVKEDLNLRLLGVLPDAANPLAEVRGIARSAYKEEIKRICLYIGKNSAVKTILMASANAEEGKSVAALALATYLAATGKKAVVIDADQVNPSIADIAQVKAAPGFTDVLRGDVDLSAALKDTQDGVHILPVGSAKGGAVDLMSSGQFAHLLSRLKSSYDYVVIDCAPVLLSSDAEMVSGMADQVIMMVERSRTPSKILKKSAEILRASAQDVPYVILNKASITPLPAHQNAA